MSPTRTYAPVIKAILKAHRAQIKGMVHCSGGAQSKVLHFTSDVKIIKDNLFPVPPLFQAIKEQSQASWSELYKVFNMGHRMEIYTDEETAKSLIEISNGFAIDAQVIGRVESLPGKNEVHLKVPGSQESVVYQ